MPDPRRVAGYCPMGCGETLFLADGGFVTCSLRGCPDPTAVTLQVLEQQALMEHVLAAEKLRRAVIEQVLDDAMREAIRRV